jgi:ATP/maltotriose-dependent transcriptional regulator MalT
MYFDYTDRKNHTRERVAAIILKQLVKQLDTVPTDLETMYDTCDRQSTRPTFSKLIELIIVLSREFGSVLVLLDAFDECDEAQQDDVLSLVCKISTSGISVFITTRLHLLETVRGVIERPTILEVNAQQVDVERYLTAKLKEKTLGEKLKADIIAAISPRARGMYVS